MENNAEKISILSKLIGNAVAFYPNEVSFILNKNGLTIDAENYNTEQLVNAVINGLYSSESFRMSFFNFLEQKEEFLNADGDVASYIGSGVTLFSSIFGDKNAKEQAKALQAQANAQAQSAQTQLEISKINQQTELAKLEYLKSGGGAASTKNNTALYIGLGVGGVVILGLVVFLAVRK